MTQSAEGPEHEEHDEGDRRFEERWRRNHGEDIPRTASGGLPLPVILIALVIFVVGFYLFRRWRSQYVDYSDLGGSGEQLQPLLIGLGLG
ncbi:hypothetical protein [Nesterenkonia muleiensis]|uniref:hypothetical protein n=1 Tax=Nesterenkonia muleiensis TaxID=2282648 RepID=UPI0013007725|nr:hypothetical protein [Nesterenkonia muleiensis]